MKSRPFIYTTLFKRVWISSYNFKNTWPWNKTLSEIFALIWSGFWPNFMELFHIVKNGILKINSKMGFIAYYKLSKMSKNSLRSFLRRENQRDEDRILSLELQVIFDEHMNQIHTRLHNLCFSGFKLVSHSIMKCLHSC